MNESLEQERKKLEAKDKDDLRAIAAQLSVHVTSRMTKAQLIEAIISAVSGGEADGAGAGAPLRDGHQPGSTPVSRSAGPQEAEAGQGIGSAENAALEPPPGNGADREDGQGAGRASAGAPVPSSDSLGLSASSGSPAASRVAQSGLGEGAPVSLQGRGDLGKGPGSPQRSDVALGNSGSSPATVGEKAAAGNGTAGGAAAAPGAGSGAGADELEIPTFVAVPYSVVEGARKSRRKKGKDQKQDARDIAQPEPLNDAELFTVAGILDLREEGYGFLRTVGYLPSPRDVYVSSHLIRRLGLRRGDHLTGAAKPPSGSEKYPALVRVDTVCGLPAEEAARRPKFEELTPLFPDERLKMEIEGEPGNVTARIIDLIAPIGKGQRGMIVSPPKAGKTTIMKSIARSIETNNPEVVLIVLLIDERPEEVTDMRRSVKGEVIASTFDRPVEEHTQVAELTLEKAKRLVEIGKDVVIILDGITRLARAYNLAMPATGRIMSGGVDSAALYPPKKFFGAARNIEEGGSLTILATALVETGSVMDEVIFQEFKGTGNMELRLDRHLSERRIFPAIDINASSTRHEELLYEPGQLDLIWKLRRVLNAISSDNSPGAGLELLIDKMRQTRSNAEFLREIAKTPGL
jgi:transcription termination factor Rho